MHTLAVASSANALRAAATWRSKVAFDGCISSLLKSMSMLSFKHTQMLQAYGKQEKIVIWERYSTTEYL